MAVSSNPTETVRFETSGRYTHVLQDKESIVYSGEGRWTVAPGVFKIELQPSDGQFLLFYDENTQLLDKQGRKYARMFFYPLPDGESFSEVSCFVSYSWTLVRVRDK